MLILNAITTAFKAVSGSKANQLLQAIGLAMTAVVFGCCCLISKWTLRMRNN